MCCSSFRSLAWELSRSTEELGASHGLGIPGKSRNVPESAKEGAEGMAVLGALGLETGLSEAELNDVLCSAEEPIASTEEGRKRRLLAKALDRSGDVKAVLTVEEWHGALWDLIMQRAEVEVNIRELQKPSSKKEVNVGDSRVGDSRVGDAAAGEKVVRYEKAIVSYVQRIKELLKHAPLANPEAKGAYVKLLKEMEEKIGASCS